MERRIVPTNVEVRAANNGPSLIRGYAAVYNQMSVVLYGMFREIVLPGAFTESIANDDIRSLWNHNQDLVLGRNRNGTLRLSEDETGLIMEVEPPDTQAGRDALVSVGRGDVNQQSFLFDVQPDGDEWYEDADGLIVRRLKRCRLYEVSPVTFPAYPQTTADVRGVDRLDVPPALPRWVAERVGNGGKQRYQQAVRELRARSRGRGIL